MNKVIELMQETFSDKRISKVLEVGSGRGDFFQNIVKVFDKDTKLIGVDTVHEYVEMARKSFDNENVFFMVMDAEKLEFEDSSFDVVCISNTLHHLPNPEASLLEMKRVTKPGGHIVFHEMFKDNQNEKQDVHVWTHHFSAEIDNELGGYHGFTYDKDQITDIINNADLSIINDAEYIIDLEQESVEILNDVFNSLEKRISQVKNQDKRIEFERRLEAEREMMINTGFELATEYLAIAKK